MATRKKAAPAAEQTTINPQAAWPFPTRQDADSGAEAAPAAERVQVASLRLYTDPAQNQVQRIGVHQLIESPFNPRTRFDEKGLQELADTIRGVGVMEPILARPTINPDLFEIVFGHRRTRAAKIAGEEDVPAIVRTLTDAQAAQLQAIENVQRKDLDPIEEAMGYDHYCRTHGVTKDQLATEVGLSRSHVYGRLKLLQLPDVVREACTKGEIGSEVALLIARIHTPKLQEKALAAIKSKYYDMEDGGQKSFRQIRELLRERFTLKLSEAIFPIADATLLSGADACTTCTKRAGNAPEYIDLAEGYKGDAWRHNQGRTQGTPNLCTDPECFEAKKKAHLKNKAAELEAKGKTVIAGNKARQLVSAEGRLKPEYMLAKDAKALLPKAKKGETPAALNTVMIQDPRGGKTIEAVKVDDLKAAGVKVKTPAKASSRAGYDYEADNRRRQEEAKKAQARAAEETRLNEAVLLAVREAAAGKPFTVQLLQLVTGYALDGVEWQARQPLASLHQFKSFEALEKAVGQMPADKLSTLLLDCVLIANVQSSGYDRDKPVALMAAAKHLEVDIAAIKKELASKPVDAKTKDLQLQELEQDDAELPDEAAASA